MGNSDEKFEKELEAELQKEGLGSVNPNPGVWTCECGSPNVGGKFCINCGKARPEAAEVPVVETSGVESSEKTEEIKEETAEKVEEKVEAVAESVEKKEEEAKSVVPQVAPSNFATAAPLDHVEKAAETETTNVVPVVAPVMAPVVAPAPQQPVQPMQQQFQPQIQQPVQPMQQQFQPQMQQPIAQQPIQQAQPMQQPSYQQAPVQQPSYQQPSYQQPAYSGVAPDAEAERKNKLATRLCIISLILNVGGTTAVGVVAGILSELGSDFTDALSTACTGLISATYIASIVLMIIARVKSKKNTFGKVLMWVYIAEVALYIIAIILIVIFAAALIASCGGGNC